MVVKNSISRGALALLAALAGGPALATGQAAPTPDVVVTAQKPLDTKAAEHFVAQISAPSQEQMAKFAAPVCPSAIGFTPAVEQLIVARIRDVATAAGAQVAPPGCQTNVVLIASYDARELIRTLRQKRQQMFTGMETTAINKLIDRDGPVRSWTLTATTSEDGNRLSASTKSHMDPSYLTVQSASFLNPSSRQVIDASYIVVDTPATFGKTVTQLADYAAMRTLAQTRPVAGGDAAVDTILSLFDPNAAPPAGLTYTDSAYLKALYALPGNRKINTQISGIAARIKQATAGAER